MTGGRGGGGGGGGLCQRRRELSQITSPWCTVHNTTAHPWQKNQNGVQESETLQPLENNWRHIQHTMFMCKHRIEGPTVQMLHHDLLAIAQSDDNPELEQLVHTTFGGQHLDWRQVQQGAVSFVMEPNAACRQAGGTTHAAKAMQRVCAAYCHGVAAAVTGEILEDFPALMRSLPDQSQVAVALALLIPNGPEIEPESDVDEWMYSDKKKNTIMHAL